MWNSFSFLLSSYDYTSIGNCYLYMIVTLQFMQCSLYMVILLGCDCRAESVDLHLPVSVYLVDCLTWKDGKSLANVVYECNRWVVDECGSSYQKMCHFWLVAYHRDWYVMVAAPMIFFSARIQCVLSVEVLFIEVRMLWCQNHSQGSW